MEWTRCVSDGLQVVVDTLLQVQFQEAMFLELDRCLTLFLVEPNYRKVLFKDNDSAHVFLNTNGAPFKSSGFSTYLSRLLSRLTGRNATSNILRSSFVTNLFESNPSDAAKSSAQSLLRHSERMQSETYDRRIPAHKKMEAQRFSSGTGKRVRGEWEAPISGRHSKAPTVEFLSGMLVAVPYIDARSGGAAFWFAKILSITTGEAQLMELKLVPASGDIYKADVKSVWAEPLNALRAVDAEYDHERKVYVLKTHVTEI